MSDDALECARACFRQAKQALEYLLGIVVACLIIDGLLLLSGVLRLLRVCGVYVRHYLPSLHPRPMVVFCRQHLRMGPVCLAHRLVSGFSPPAVTLF